ncbi:MAG: hypothetical protein K6E91_00640 [Butyrivibrio sp.]|nr:hypothetical protein [Butyrivibrio sp.]
MSEGNQIYREESIERISSPEKLNDYIRVSSPSMWLIMAAIIILLLGVLAYSIFGSVTVNNPDGTSEVKHPISFVVN